MVIVKFVKSDLDYNHHFDMAEYDKIMGSEIYANYSNGKHFSYVRRLHGYCYLCNSDLAQNKYLNHGLLKSERKYLDEFNYTAIFYEDDGIAINSECKFFKNMFHCETGPAKIYYENGVIVDADYYLNNESISKQQWEEQIATKLYW